MDFELTMRLMDIAKKDLDAACDVVKQQSDDMDVIKKSKEIGAAYALLDLYSKMAGVVVGREVKL